MKKYLLLFVTIIIVSLSCVSCKNPAASSVQTGSIRISAVPSGETISNMAARNLYVWDGEIAYFKAEGTGPDSQTFAVQWNINDPCTVDDLYPGEWGLTVTSYDSDDTPITRGSTTVTVLSNTTVSALITLGVIEGAGSISFSISWSAEETVTSVVVIHNGINYPLTINAAENSATLVMESIVAGRAHEFSIGFFDASGNPLCPPQIITVHVTDGRDSPVVFTLADGLIIHPITGLTAQDPVAGIFCVDLSWTDPSRETEILVERRESGGNWQTIAFLPADSVMYRDENAPSLSSLEYRISAINETSEANSNTLSISTPDFSSYIKSSKFAFGNSNGYRVLDDGTVIGFGTNDFGQLGFSADEMRIDGVAINGLSNIRSIKSSVDSFSYMLALDNDGVVWQWGRLSTPDYLPARVAGLPRQILDISVADYTYLALDADGHLWVWGSNNYGQYGNGTTTSSSSPIMVEGLPPIASASLGARHVVAITETGEVYVWGANNSGQLGLGDTTDRTVPVKVTGIDNAVAARPCVQINTYRTHIVLDDGTVLFAGSNFWDYYGLPEASTILSFTQISDLSDVVDLYDSSRSVIVLKEDGSLWGANSNFKNILLAGWTDDPDNRFQALTGAPSNVTKIIGGAYSFWCEDASGVSYVWGDNTCGQLMQGNASRTYSPVQITTTAPFVSIEGGASHYLALDSDGAVWAWGDNTDGQLGDGTTISKATPFKVPGLPATGAVQILATGNNSAALYDNGAIYTWGNNTSGSSAVLFNDVNLGIDTVELAMGSWHYLARRSDNTVWAWGQGWDGQLGNGNKVSSTVAVQVLGTNGVGSVLDNAVSIAAGPYTSSALLSNGTIVAWGDNGDYLLGNGSSSSADSSIPIVVNSLSSADSLFMEASNAFAIQDGVLWAWGQIASSIYPEPTSAKNLAGVVDLVSMDSGTYPVSVALLSDGSVRTIGGNSRGLLGNGTFDGLISSWFSPIGPIGVNDIAITDTSVLALAHDESSGLGTLWFWGENQNGEAGNGTFSPLGVGTPIQCSW